MMFKGVEALERRVSGARYNSAYIQNAKFVLDKFGDLYGRYPRTLEFFHPLPSSTIDLDAVALRVRREVQRASGVRGFNHIAGFRNRHIVQAVAIANYSGLINHEGSVLVDDLCGGKGLVSAVSGYLRRDVGETISRCIELNSALRDRHDLVGQVFGIEARRDFLAQDIHRYPFRRISDDPYYCVAKHACGTLTDRIIQGVTSQGIGYGPDHTLVMPCCYGRIRAGQHVNPRLGGVIEKEDWFRLAGLTEASGHPASVQRLTAKVAMALFDCLRCFGLPDRFQPVVAEIVPPEVTPMNQAIILFDREAKY